MRKIPAIRFAAAAGTLALLGVRLLSHAEPGDTVDQVRFVGVFDPFECYDKTVKDAIVLKARPDCGSCHAQATILRTTDGAMHLSLAVDHGAQTNTWTMLGTNTPDGVVFSKEKMTLTYSQNRIKGRFEGRMRAGIDLGPVEASGQPAPAR